MILGVQVPVGTALFFPSMRRSGFKKPMLVLVDVMAANPTIVFGL